MQLNYNEQVLNPTQVIQHPDGSSHFVGEACPTGQCDGYGNPIQITPFSQGMLPSAQDIENNYSTDNVRWLQAIADKGNFGVKFNDANEINAYYDKQAIDRMRRTPEWNQAFSLGVDQFGNEGAGVIADNLIANRVGLQDSMYNVGQTATNADEARNQVAAMNVRADLLNSDPYNTNSLFARQAGIQALTPYTNNNGEIIGITNGQGYKLYSPDLTDNTNERLIVASADPNKALVDIVKANNTLTNKTAPAIIKADASKINAQLKAASMMATEREKAAAKLIQDKLKYDLEYQELQRKKVADAKKGNAGTSNLLLPIDKP